jgi:hypothetical protein
MLLLEDARLAGLASATCAWMVVWAAVLLAVPAGASGRNHIVSLNAAHGVVCTAAAASTIYFGWDPTQSVAISLAYFLVDLVAMVQGDGLTKLHTLQRSRQMDYGHHVLGVFWGTVLFAHDDRLCTSSLANPYVWIQTNEISTPFYNWFRLTNNKVAGALFAGFFFLSRVAGNTLYVIPRLWSECDRRYLLGCAPYFLLQYAWFAMIVQKMRRVTTKAAVKTD